MTRRRWVALGLLVLGGARAEAQGRVVPEPGAPPRRARVVPAPRGSQPRKPRAQAKPKVGAKAPTRTTRKAPVPRRVPAPVVRQVAPPAAPLAASGPGGELTVTLVTFGIGEAVWERFGHNALWIHDAKAGTDIAYNWAQAS